MLDLVLKSFTDYWVRLCLEFLAICRDGFVSGLLALAAGEFDVLLTADKGMEYQQNQATLPVAILIVLARSNRIEDMAAAVPAILSALEDLAPRTLGKVAA